MKFIDKEAKSKEDAIKNALKELNLNDEKEADLIKVLSSSKKNGFLGIGNGSIVKVRVIKFDELEKNIIEELRTLLTLLNFDVKYIKIKDIDENNKYLIEFDSKDAAIIIGKRGKTLEALQFLLNVVVNNKYGNPDTPIKILLDIQNYRNKRVKSLEKLAKHLVLKVRKTKKPRILEPMNPYERKIIHTVIQNENDIVAISIGDGIYKKLKIMLKDEKEN